jgi:hypothetical protein
MARLLLSLVFLLVVSTACAPAASPVRAPAPAAVVSATPVLRTAVSTRSGAPTVVSPRPPGPPLEVPTGAAGTSLDPWAIYASALRPQAQQGIDFKGMTQYHLSVELPADLRTVAGSARIDYTNRAKDALDRIYLHLYPNLWHAGMTATNVRVDGQPVSTTLHAQNSLLEVRLSSPLGPGQNAEMTLDFSVPIPHDRDVGNYAEFAYQDGVLALAQFYPTVAVYDDHWHKETPALEGDVVLHDASLYDISLTAPITLTVAASGRTASRGDNDNGTATWRLAGGPMRDFNIVASERFHEASEQVDGITVNSYFLADDDKAGNDALNYATDALKAYQGHFGPYPYTELDVVETSTTALGIEYPGLIVLARHGQYDVPARQRLLQGTTAHEIAHQWWYNVVGDDQVNTPWMDEALAQYSTYLYFKDRYGDQGGQELLQDFKSRWDRVQDADIPIGLPVASYKGPEYGAIVYGRGPLFLVALQDRIGQEKMLRFLQEYYRKYEWKIATPAEFQDLVQQVSAQDLSDLFDQWVYPKK